VIERKRALKVWRQYCLLIHQKESKVKTLLSKCYQNKIDGSFQRWRQWSIQLNEQCHLELLKRQFTQNMYLSTLHSNLTERTSHLKHLKKTRMIRIWKCWVAYVNHRKLMLQLNVQAIKFLEANRLLTLQQCYSAMRLSKESSKGEIVESAVTNEMDRDLEQLSKFISRKK
jgi:hypothetical protein